MFHQRLVWTCFHVSGFFLLHRLVTFYKIIFTLLDLSCVFLHFYSRLKPSKPETSNFKRVTCAFTAVFHANIASILALLVPVLVPVSVLVPVPSLRFHIDRSGSSLVEAQSGQTARLPCTVVPHSALQSVHIQWTKDGQIISDSRYKSVRNPLPTLVSLVTHILLNCFCYWRIL